MAINSNILGDAKAIVRKACPLDGAGSNGPKQGGSGSGSERGSPLHLVARGAGSRSWLNGRDLCKGELSEFLEGIDRLMMPGSAARAKQDWPWFISAVLARRAGWRNGKLEGHVFAVSIPLLPAGRQEALAEREERGVDLACRGGVGTRKKKIRGAQQRALAEGSRCCFDASHFLLMVCTSCTGLGAPGASPYLPVEPCRNRELRRHDSRFGGIALHANGPRGVIRLIQSVISWLQAASQGKCGLL